MSSCIRKGFNWIFCKNYSKFSNDGDVTIDFQAEPAKGHGQASSVSSQQQDGKNGGHDIVERRKNKDFDRFKSVKHGEQRQNATCSDKKDEKTMVHPEFEFFWKENSPFSQWYQKEFIVEEQIFSTAEQYMMYRKAKLFNDDETATKILTEKNPKEQKKLGRQVKNFNSELWKKNCISIVKEGNRNKFLQNEDLCQLLFSTYPKTLVEASPYDKVWGIGRAASDPKAQTKETWDGHNLLGYALTDVRNELMKKNDAPTCPVEKALMDINLGEDMQCTFM